MAAHSKESEIYRCNDPRQSGGEVFSQAEGGGEERGKTYVVEIERKRNVWRERLEKSGREKLEEKKREREKAQGSAGGIRAAEG